MLAILSTLVVLTIVVTKQEIVVKIEQNEKKILIGVTAKTQYTEIHVFLSFGSTIRHLQS